MRNHSNENEFDLHENAHAIETNFHMNGFELRLVSKRGKSQLGNGLFESPILNLSIRKG